MELYDTEIRDKYYYRKRELKRLLNELQTADDIIQVSQIHRAIDDIIRDLVSLITPNREYIAMDIDAVKDLLSKAERQEDDGKKA